MKIEKVYKVDEIEAFSGLRDYFKNAMYVVINEDLRELRLYGKNKEYKKSRKALDARKLHHIHVPKYLEVIDISEKTATFLNDKFGEYKHTEFNIHVN